MYNGFIVGGKESEHIVSALIHFLFSEEYIS